MSLKVQNFLMFDQTFSALFKEIPYRDPLEIFQIFRDDDYSVFIDSTTCDRYSYIASKPFLSLKYCDEKVFLNGKATQGDVFLILRKLIQEHPICSQSGDLPPFQGGAIGFLSYDLCRFLEKLGPCPKRLQSCPALNFGFYDSVLAFDHFQRRAWIFCSDFSENEIKDRKARAREKIECIYDRLCSSVSLKETCFDLESSLQPDFDCAAYMRGVELAKQAIFEGEFFELNFTQRYHCFVSDSFDSFALYKRHRSLSPTPFSAYLNFDKFTIASSSPERFLCVKDQRVFAAPMKGTRRRSANPLLDEVLAKELYQSGKDRAENVMIVDLFRNDLSKVCSLVELEKLCELESFSSVHQLVSKVRGRLKEGFDAIDCLQAAFPSGSITGAPKPRAMEFIDQLERSSRGSYCGSVVILGFNAYLDSSVLIRSFSISDNVLSFGVGGAVVLESDPKAEYEEMLLKAKTMKEALKDPRGIHL